MEHSILSTAVMSMPIQVPSQPAAISALKKVGPELKVEDIEIQVVETTLADMLKRSLLISWMFASALSDLYYPSEEFYTLKPEFGAPL